MANLYLQAAWVEKKKKQEAQGTMIQSFYFWIPIQKETILFFHLFLLSFCYVITSH